MPATCAVPEKSAKVSKPPERPRSLDEHGQIQEKELEPGVLVNRMTADWYLPMLRAEAEWKLGFLAVVADEDEAARRHFDQAPDLRGRIDWVPEGSRIDISATGVRRRVAEGHSIRYLVPEAVEALIREHRLYVDAGD